MFSASSGTHNELREPGLERGTGNFYQAQGRNGGLGSRKSEGSFDLILRQSSQERMELLQRKQAAESAGMKEEQPAFRPIRSNRDARSDRTVGSPDGNGYAEEAARAEAASESEEDQAADFGLLANLSGLIQEDYAEEGEGGDEASEVSFFERLLTATRDAASSSTSRPVAEGQSFEDVSLQFLQGRADGLQLDPVQSAGGKSGLEMLNFQELMDPDIKIEAGDDLMERLQQALITGNTAALDEAGELVAPQVVRGLAALMRGNGVSELRLQLQPKDLGEIELRVRALEGIVRGEISVQSAEVKQLLESQIERLRVALAQQGFELDGFDIEVADRHSPFEQAGSGWAGDDARGDARTGQGRRGGEAETTMAVGDDGAGGAPLTLTGDHEVNLVA